MYHPSDLDILFSFACIFYKTGAYEEARSEVMERLMALSPEYQGAKEILESISTASVNNYQLKVANKTDTSSGDSVARLNEQGRINKTAGKYSEAFECFSMARKLGDLISEMGDCKANNGRHEGGEGFYEEGVLRLR